MSIAEKLQHHIARRHVQFDVREHEATSCAMSTAEACRVAPDRLAKAVIIRADGSYWVAVLPASQRLSLSRLKSALSQDCALATEAELDRLFDDCAHGAIPPIGECYGLDVIADPSIFEPPEVYFEGGDHLTLVHMSRAQFASLNEDAHRARFAAAFE